MKQPTKLAEVAVPVDQERPTGSTVTTTRPLWISAWRRSFRDQSRSVTLVLMKARSVCCVW